MFCKKCGRKIEWGTSKCSHCGELATKAEYCGGFWEITRIGHDSSQKEKDRVDTEDLSRYRDAVLAIKREENLIIEQRNEEIEKMRDERHKLKSAHLRMTVLSAILIVMLTLLFIFTVREYFEIRDLKKELNQYQTQTIVESEKNTEKTDPSSDQNAETPVPKQHESEISDSKAAGLKQEKTKSRPDTSRTDFEKNYDAERTDTMNSTTGKTVFPDEH